MIIKEKRTSLIKNLFPSHVPQIWCPPLTHYNENGEIDFNRMKKHIEFLIPYIHSFLIPGSTGDGWELKLSEYKSILEFIHKEFGTKNKINLIIGLLREDPKDRMEFLDHAISFLKEKNIEIKANGSNFGYFKGFVICPKKGKELTQDEIKNDIIELLEKDYPFVLYQLPQVTENELTPELVEYLVKSYYNVYMLKDSSGADRIANSDRDYRSLVILRGAEGNYFEQLKVVGGRYDGFLLSTGNSFPKELYSLIDLINKGKNEQAQKLSERLTNAVNEVFKLAQTIPEGNAFTNSNKLIDHFNAYGEKWRDFSAPRLHSGKRIDDTLLEQTVKILIKYEFLKKEGYMF
ncbi:MAG: dihydrodipicolinate synthase family protein [Candidatus Heimdallarchaeaceae archaeon]